MRTYMNDVTMVTRCDTRVRRDWRTDGRGVTGKARTSYHCRTLDRRTNKTNANNLTDQTQQEQRKADDRNTQNNINNNNNARNCSKTTTLVAMTTANETSQQTGACDVTALSVIT